MSPRYRSLAGPAEVVAAAGGIVAAAGGVVAAAGGRAYARFATGVSASVVGLAGGGAVLWWGESMFGPLGHALGPGPAVDALLAAADASGELPTLRWINLPRRPLSRLPAGYGHHEDWDLRWTGTPPPRQPGQDRVVRVDDAGPQITALLDAALPDTPLRPGTRLVRGWYGVWAGPTLVACAADRSPGLGSFTPSGGFPAGGIGVIGAVAVHPRHRRAGLGAAVSAAVTASLLDEYPLVALGVDRGNTVASRVYERIGFTGCHGLTSVRPT